MFLRKWKKYLNVFALVVGVFILIFNYKNTKTRNSYSEGPENKPPVRKAKDIIATAISNPRYKINYSEYISNDYLSTHHQIENKNGNDGLVTNIFNRSEWLNLIDERIHSAQQNCLKHSSSTYRRRNGMFYLYEPDKVAYCEVPKNGCTFWKGIMRFLNRDFEPTNKNISRPSDLTRQFIHFGKFKTTPTFRLGEKDAAKLENMTNSFMFARDPYSRLWSAYLDKIFLPDFWSLGRRIVLAERQKPDSLSLRCGHDVTFPEFIRYIVRRRLWEWHFDPIHTVCDPCRTKFRFIGKLETFVQDTKHIINETGIVSDLGNDIFSNTAVTEIRSLTEDYLNLNKPWTNTVCYNETLICERLWKVFQLNGYIGFENPFPSYLSKFNDSKTLENKFIERAIEVHENSKMLHQVWKKQKRESVIKAYGVIDAKTLGAFRAKYEKDFEIFNYEKEPSDIYATRTNGSNSYNI